MARTSNRRYHGIQAGFRSGLEETVAEDLKRRGVNAKYEQTKIRYMKPEKAAFYTPDFKFPKHGSCPICRGDCTPEEPCWHCDNIGVDQIYVETKGRFVTADRQKHVLIKEQHPDLDIRFLFQNSRARISKTSKTTYAAWCEKHGFQFADKRIPEEWLNED